MKKLSTLLFLFVLAFGTTLHADYQGYSSSQGGYDQCCEQYCDPCDPCAPACGTCCGINWWGVGVGVVAVAAVIAIIATGGDDSSTTHNHS